MNRCLIRNSDVYSIPGGWTLQHPSLAGRLIAERSPDHAVAQLLALLRVNNIAATADELWTWANLEWGRRVIAAGQPERWMGPPIPRQSEPAPPIAKLRTILTPKVTGPPLWGTLHLIPLVFTAELWRSHLALMTVLITPGGYEPGCRQCAAHWASFRKENPPERVADGKAAASWSWSAHNAASRHAGRPEWTWRQAAAQWGWPGEWE